jgi:UPF0716 protein FxsA
MLWRLVLLMTLVPLAELLLLVRLAQFWGFWTTVGIVIGTGLAGAALARAQGLRVVAAIRQKLGRGELPADDLLDGLMVLVAAAFLVTPGVMTDTAGLLLLIPFTRRVLRDVLKRWLARRAAAGQIFVHTESGFDPINDEPPPGAPPLEETDER